MKSTHSPRKKGLLRRGPVARKSALYFCVIWLMSGLVGLISLESCAHNTAVNTGSEFVSSNEETPADEVPNSAVTPGNSYVHRRKNSRKDIDRLEEELERQRAENQFLREENDWLRVEILRLQQALIDANQNIYSLNRKLDAIFKPNNAGE